DRVLDQVPRESKQSKADVHVIAGPHSGAQELLGAGLPEWCAGLPLGREALDPVADAPPPPPPPPGPAPPPPTSSPPRSPQARWPTASRRLDSATGEAWAATASSSSSSE